MDSSIWTTVLNELNRDVARAQPNDIWQFCANWFNNKLAEQRTSSRPAAASLAKDARSHSLPLDSPISPGTIRKKQSHPSLVGKDYTFGSANSHSAIPAHLANPDSTLMSPFSENGPTATNTEAPASPFGLAAAHGSRGASRMSGPPSSPVRKTEVNSASSTPTSAWSKSNARKNSQDAESDEEEVYDPRDNPSQQPGAANPVGVPVGYNLARRTSVSAESLDPSAQSNLPKTVVHKSSSQRARIEASIKGNLLFRNLDEEQHNDVLNAMKEVRVPQGTEVIVQGAVGDFFYVVENGKFEVWVKPQATHSYDAATRQTITDSPPAKMVATIESGGSFGELALMYNAPRSATVIAVSSSSTLWALDRVTFRSILMMHTSRKRKMYEDFLAEVNILVSLEPHERAKIADALEEKVYEEGEAVVIEGEVGKNFYIIESGQAEVLKRRGGRGEDERVSTLAKGDYFGELALLNSAPRAATVRAMPGRGRLRVATLGEKAFTRLLGPVVDILQRRAQSQYGAPSNPTAGSASNSSRPPRAHSAGYEPQSAYSSNSLRTQRTNSFGAPQSVGA